MSQGLFQEFEEVSAKEWKQKIQFELKGADYNEKLVYKSRDGINVKPFYNSEDISETPKAISPKNWEICEKIYVASEEKSNQKAQDALKKGAESLWLILPSEKVNLQKLFKDLDLEKVPVYLGLEFHSEGFFANLNKFLSGK
ncbi:MAG: methylmalonyl-CoA mutase, partial [Bacteroidota bacterium]